MSRMIRYTLCLPKIQVDELRALAINGITVSEQIRTSINEYLKDVRKNTFSTSPSKDHISTEYAPSKGGE